MHENESGQQQVKQAQYDNRSNLNPAKPSEFGSAIGTVGLAGGYDSKQAIGHSLRDRVHAQIHRATNEARRIERLNELAILLERNPEVARILDLIEEVRG